MDTMNRSGIIKTVYHFLIGGWGWHWRLGCVLLDLGRYGLLGIGDAHYIEWIFRLLAPQGQDL